MNYELAKKLKDAGFLQKPESYPFVYDKNGTLAHMISDRDWNMQDTDIKIPTLSELIEACGKQFGFLILNQENGMWLAREKGIEPIHPELSGHKHYDTPEEAVAKLWLELNKK